MSSGISQPEPWLRGTHQEVSAAQRAVLHALELAEEDLEKWCAGLTEDQLNARHGAISPVAFHLRHIAGSMDRLLTYAEGRQLSEEQLNALKAEGSPNASREEVFAELKAAFRKSAERVRAFSASQLEQVRGVGKKQLPTSVGGLLVHVADHTQRHVGQAITTAKLVRGQ